MLKVEALLITNCVMAISEALRKIDIGGMTVGKVRGRGKNNPPRLHAAKGSALFQPHFNDRYIITIVIPTRKEDAVINILKTLGTGGKGLCVASITCYRHFNWP